MFDHLSEFDIILGSGSPRRKELLSKLGLPFRTLTARREEIVPDSIPIDQVAVFLACQKASELRMNLTVDFILICADTIVINEGQILGKPANIEGAKNMLRSLSGSFHEVVTGVCIKGDNHSIELSETTRVKFEELTENEIDHYCNNSKVMDKAGSYGIQDWLGLSRIGYIEGSFFNVMGLPVHKVYRALRDWPRS